MITESRIKSIENRLDELTLDLIQMQKNQIPIVSKISDNTDNISRISPYTDTKKAYYNEKEKTFYNVPQGNILVQFSNYQGSYAVNRIADRLTVTFEQLTDNTDITITIK
jgi:hypothetical protein